MPSPSIAAYNDLRVVKLVSFGAYLDGGSAGEILLPTRFLPRDAKPGDVLRVFLYHDGEGRIIATTQEANAIAGEIALMKVVSKNAQGAFLDWGLMKDLFLPLSQQSSRIAAGQEVLVYVYIDEQTGRAAATEKLGRYIRNEELSIHEMDVVQCIVWQKTDIGYRVVINNRHQGMVHFNDVFTTLKTGDRFEGFIKGIYPDGKIDVAIGKRGFERVEEAHEKILRLLEEHNGYLPYHDKSEPEEIYGFFGMSKKTFKAAVGVLYKAKKVELAKAGIKLLV